MSSTYRRVRNAAGLVGYAKMVPFIYTVTIPAPTIANGASVSGEIRIDPGLPFILTEMGFEDSADTATTTSVRKWGVNIVDGNSQQLFSSNEAPRERMFGTRDFPRQLPAEVEFAPATVLTITCTNRTGVATAAGDFLRPTFTGYKLVGFSTNPPPE